MMNHRIHPLNRGLVGGKANLSPSQLLLCVKHPKRTNLANPASATAYEAMAYGPTCVSFMPISVATLARGALKGAGKGAGAVAVPAHAPGRASFVHMMRVARAPDCARFVHMMRVARAPDFADLPPRSLQHQRPAPLSL